MQSTGVRETIGVASSRPELRCPSSNVVQEFEDREWKVNLAKNLMQCTEMIHVEGRFADALVEDGYTSPETPFLFQLEKSLLDVSSPLLTDGVFYCTLFRMENRFLCRFFESGVFIGYFLSEGIKLIKDKIREIADDISVEHLVWSQVSTEDDIKEYHYRYSKRLERKRSHQSISNPSADIGRRYNSIMNKNKFGVINSHRNLMAKAQSQVQDNSCSLLGSVLHVLKQNHHKAQNPLQARFLDSSGVLHPILHLWENSLNNFRVNGAPVQQMSFDSVFQLPTSSSFSLHEQCEIISSFPNNHYWNESGQAHVGYGRMLSTKDSSGKYNPASVRNLTLFHFRDNNFSSIYKVISKLKNLDSTGTTTSSTHVPPEFHDHLNESVPPQRQTRTRRRVLTEEDILRNLSTLDPTFRSQNRASVNPLYEVFKTAQLEKGEIFWRIHQPDFDLLCMNDVNMNTGLFSDFSYVHLSRCVIGNDVQFSCTCHLYATLLQLATLNENIVDEDLDVNDIKCCHIRFFQELIEPAYETFFNSDSVDQPNSRRKIYESLKTLGKTVCILRSSVKTSKFSVVSADSSSCTFVHISKNRVSCQSGECQAIYGCSQRKIIYLDQTANICPHLEEMKQNKNLWMTESTEVIDEEDDEEDQVVEDFNADDEEPIEVLVTDNSTGAGNFDTVSGLWNFPSLSEHCPKRENDPVLQSCIQSRLAIHDGSPGVHRDVTGYLTREAPFLLCPAKPQTDCHCGAGYFNEEHPDGILSDIQYKPIVYLSNGPARYVVRNRECLARSQDCTIPYSGEADGIHFLSKETAAGDEIGWDYVDHALNSHITFSAFCKMMSKKYLRVNFSSAKFMSVQSFISWWFSWSSNFKIDFRQPCTICKFNPKFLACDGTKIGISFKHAKVEPIEKPKPDAELIDPCHRRNDRAFLRFVAANTPQQNETIRACRDHLNYISRKVLGTLNDKDILSFQEETNRSEILIRTVDHTIADVIRRFVCNDYSVNLRKRLAVVLQALSTNHSITALIPFRYTDLLLRVLSDLQNGQNNSINLISEFSPEIRDILYSAQPHRDSLNDIILFFQYLVRRIQELQALNKDQAPPNPQIGSYNPEKNGVAYYFTASGEKLRDLPRYTMNENAHSLNYDDLPARANEQCNKIYPEVSRKGTTYLFLWFDPKHYGHCYGFHVIPGSEGRKDPFTSAYCYMENAPEEVFYDFSCQLEEYCLNREPGFWQNTRFWHDIFHGFSHKCPFPYKSQRLAPLQGLNTEICEQFNSFIQKIKYSARSMTLSKFCYYLQFMIFQWCEAKRIAFEKRCNIASLYLL